MRRGRARGVVAAAAAGIAVAVVSANARAKTVPEVPAPWLDDVALAVTTEKGPVIFYNPSRCKQVGLEVCTFFRVHEYAHLRLGHDGAFYSKFGGRALAEAEADCWAARNAMRAPVKAAIAYFESKEHADEEVDDHGTGRERAKRIRECRGS